MTEKRFTFSTLLLTLARVYGTSYSASGQNYFSVEPNLTYTANPDPNAKSLRQSDDKLAHLKAKLIEANSLQDEKIISDLKREVKDALNEHVVHDLADQESELARLGKRADNVESQNKQRRSTRNEIIDLQLQSYVLEKDITGLGCNSPEDQSLINLGRMDQSPKEDEGHCDEEHQKQSVR